MFSEFGKISQLMVPVFFSIGGIGAGILFEKFILPGLKKIVERTPWKWDDILISSFGGVGFIFFTCLGFYLGINHVADENSVWMVIFDKSIIIAAILAISLLVSRVTANLLRLSSPKKRDIVPATSIIANITTLFIFIAGFLMILHTVGISIAPMLTAFGIGGLAVALALRETLSNLFAGIHILASRHINPGDFIQIDQEREGYVTDVTWRNTTIKTIQDNIIVIPNSKLVSAIVANYHLPVKEFTMVVSLGVGYDSDLVMVEKVTIDVAKEIMSEVKGGIPEYDPVVRFREFGEYSIKFIVTMRVKEYIQKYHLRHEFIKRLHQRYRESGIIIPYPVQRIYLNAGREISTGD